jgi:hypothetical protein
VSSTDLAVIAEEQVAVRIGRMASTSMAVVQVADRTHEIPRDPETGALMRPQGMSDADWNIHCDSMRSARNAPLYMVEHYRRVETAQKLAGLKGAELPKIAQYVVNVTMQERPKYPVIDVAPIEEGK